MRLFTALSCLALTACAGLLEAQSLPGAAPLTAPVSSPLVDAAYAADSAITQTATISGVFTLLATIGLNAYRNWTRAKALGKNQPSRARRS